jgi:hypothetical protein
LLSALAAANSHHLPSFPVPPLQARAEAQAQQLQREKLAGEKKTLGEQDKSEKAAYKLLVRAGAIE